MLRETPDTGATQREGGGTELRVGSDVPVQRTLLDLHGGQVPDAYIRKTFPERQSSANTRGVIGPKVM